MSRRRFIGTLATVSTAASLGIGSSFARHQRSSLAQIASGSELPLPGTSVSLRTADGQIEQGLIEHVTSVRFPAHKGAPGTEQVSLLIDVNISEPAGGNYRVTTDTQDLGELDLMPVGPAGRDRRLEAVINRIV